MTAVLGCLIWACIFGPQPVPAQILKLTPERISEDDSQLPWELQADEVTFDQQLNQYIARGNVQIYKSDMRLTADTIRYDHIAQRAYARGNVVLTVGQDILSGSYMELDLENQVGFIENAYLFLKENNFHITADKIEKTGKETYRMQDATLTTCDGPEPSWRIRAREAKVKADGAGTGEHVTFRARNMPVFYTPYFRYPARKDRQSGFLTPQFGESERRGYQYNQPFFWAISESTDATFYGHYMSNRGNKYGAEFRYYLSEDAKGMLMLDGIKDDKTDTGGQSSIDYGFRDDGEQVLRTNDERWWFRMSHHQLVPLDFFAKLDLDIIKDQDYLKEFREGRMGFNDTNGAFRDMFKRHLDDFNDPIRTNRLNLNRLWPSYSLNFEPRWNHDSRREINTSDTLQRLPLISFDGAKQKMMASPFYFDLGSQYNYFWRDSGTRGQRLDLQPRFYLPFRVQNFLTIEPSAGYRQTLYRLDENNFEDQPDADRWSHRELFDTRLELFTEVEKVYNLEGWLFEKIKHRIRPQITHEFISNSKQSNLPRFDALDRIDETNKITYALTNTLTSKSSTGQTVKSNQDLPINRGAWLQTTDGFEYNDFFRLKIQHGYDFERSTRPFLPVSAKLDVNPRRYFTIDADAQYSVYDNKFLSHNVKGTLRDNRGDSIRVDYRYERASEETNNDKDIEFITGSLRVSMTDKFSVNGAYSYNLETDQRAASRVGFIYDSQCWTLYASYLNRPNDWAFSFTIELLGLGKFRY
ncbi:MAG: LPS assembly protein LptD [Desulfobacterales bacterium]|jgi:LPS-assembly protein